MANNGPDAAGDNTARAWPPVLVPPQVLDNGPPPPPPIPMTERVRTWPQPDMQLSSPLYNGRIPPEIRNLIFEFALTETTIPNPDWERHDFAVRYDHEPAGDAPPEPSEQDGPVEADADADADAGAEATANGAAAALHPARRQRVPQKRWHVQEKRENGMDWLRPGYTGRKTIYCELLRTCRRVYLETAHLPAVIKEHVFYCADGRYPPWRSPGPASDPKRYMMWSVTHQAARWVREMHLFTQMYWLETKFPDMCCASTAQKRETRLPSGSTSDAGSARVLDRIETVHLTLRHRDWWWNERNEPLRINPFESRFRPPAPSPIYDDMTMPAVIARTRQGLPQPEIGWGAWPWAFAQMPALRTLIMDFETSEDKVDELKEIVEWARTWRFPVYKDFPAGFVAAHRDRLPDNLALRYDEEKKSTWDPVAERWLYEYGTTRRDFVRRGWLTAARQPVRKMSWRGLPHHWPTLCRDCRADGNTNPQCQYCLKRERLLAEGKGPRLYVWTLTWKVEMMGDDYGLGEDVLAAAFAADAEAAGSADCDSQAQEQQTVGGEDESGERVGDPFMTRPAETGFPGLVL